MKTHNNQYKIYTIIIRIITIKIKKLKNMDYLNVQSII